MKKYYMVLLALVVVAALSVSGCCCCSGIPGIGGGDIGNLGVPTSLPGNNNGGGTSSGDGKTLSTGSLFDNSNLNYYEWRWTSTSNGETNTFNYRVERGTGTFQGATAKFKKVTFTDNGENPNTMTVYYDSDNKVIGVMSDDEEIALDQGGEQMAGLYDAFDIGAIWANYDYPLENSIPETLTINGKTYVCQKYVVGSLYGGTSVWSSTVNGKPMAVQMKYSDMQGNSLLYQLWDWG